MPRKVAKKDVGVYRVEAIVDRRRKNGKVQYKIKWEGYLEPSWIPASLGAGCADLINLFKKENLPPGGKYSPVPSDDDYHGDEEMLSVQSSRTERLRKRQEMNEKNGTEGGVQVARSTTGSGGSVASQQKPIVEDGILSQGRSPYRLPPSMAAGDRRARSTSTSTCPYSPLRIETSDDDDDGEIATAARAAKSASTATSRVDSETAAEATEAQSVKSPARAASPMRIDSEMEDEKEVTTVANGVARPPSDLSRGCSDDEPTPVTAAGGMRFDSPRSCNKAAGSEPLDSEEENDEDMEVLDDTQESSLPSKALGVDDVVEQITVAIRTSDAMSKRRASLSSSTSQPSLGLPESSDEEEEARDDGETEEGYRRMTVFDTLLRETVLARTYTDAEKEGKEEEECPTARRSRRAKRRIYTSLNFDEIDEETRARDGAKRTPSQAARIAARMSSIEEEEVATEERARGTDADSSEGNDKENEKENSPAAPVKRGIGRPRKHPINVIQKGKDMAKKRSLVVPVKRGRGRPRIRRSSAVQNEQDKEKSSSPVRASVVTPDSVDIVVQSEKAVEEREKSTPPACSPLPSDAVDVMQISSDDDSDVAMKSSSTPCKLVRIAPLNPRRTICRWTMDEIEEEREEEDRFLQRERRHLQRVFARRTDDSSSDEEETSPRRAPEEVNVEEGSSTVPDDPVGPPSTPTRAMNESAMQDKVTVRRRRIG